MSSFIPDRGDLVYLNFNPQSGHEQAGRRPAIVLSPEAFNFATGFAVCCPITNQQKGYPFEVTLPSTLKIRGVILSDQVKSLDWRSRNLEIKDKAPQNITDEVLDKIHTFL
ncbi:endoribonuclease MazF [Brevibacillus laterosporus]|uniref:endoribonuclease MazF n=1 Tax=Brevibacillus laterosporus TaxID=1465 RepID=UPI002E245539|nr:endoribonuclease MazF [Brevibacillus laterosporus]